MFTDTHGNVKLGPFKPPAKVFVDESYKHLTVLREDGRTAAGARVFLCRCECGRKKRATGHQLRSGRIASCGQCDFAHPGQKRDAPDRYDVNGRAMTIREIGAEFGVRRTTFMYRLGAGMTATEAATAPVKKRQTAPGHCVHGLIPMHRGVRQCLLCRTERARARRQSDPGWAEERRSVHRDANMRRKEAQIAHDAAIARRDTRWLFGGKDALRRLTGESA